MDTPLMLICISQAGSHSTVGTKHIGYVIVNLAMYVIYNQIATWYFRISTVPSLPLMQLS